MSLLHIWPEKCEKLCAKRSYGGQYKVTSMHSSKELLQEYTRTRSEAVLRQIMQQHFGLVYAAALRVTRSEALAKEVTQDVFILLARKPQVVPDHIAFAAWLHRTTRFTAIKLVRSETRRRAREACASELQDMNSTDSLNDELAPLVDELLDELPSAERGLLAAHFLEGIPLDQLARQLGIQENAARMRVSRALEKMRGRLATRGIATTAAVLASTLPSYASASVPASLTHSVFAHVLAANAATSPIGTGVSITLMKLKTTAIAVTVVALISVPVWQRVELTALRKKNLAEASVSQVPHSSAASSRKIATATTTRSGTTPLDGQGLANVALQLVRIKNPVEREAALAKWAENFLSNEDIQQLIKEIRSRKDFPSAYENLIAPHLVRQWALVAPAECIAWFYSGRNNVFAGNSPTNENLFNLVATTNPTAFAAWANQLTPEAFAKLAQGDDYRRTDVAQTIARYQPSRALALLDAAPSVETMRLLGKGSNGQIFYDQLRESFTPESLMEIFEKVPSSPERTEMLQRIVHDQLAADPRPLGELIQQTAALKSQDAQSVHLTAIASRIESGYAAAKQGGEHALDEWFAGVQMYANAVNASASAGTPASDDTRMRFASLVASEDPVVAIQWAQSIKDPEKRLLAAARLAAGFQPTPEFDPANLRLDNHTLFYQASDDDVLDDLPGNSVRVTLDSLDEGFDPSRPMSELVDLLKSPVSNAQDAIRGHYPRSR